MQSLYRDFLFFNFIYSRLLSVNYCTQNVKFMFKNRMIFVYYRYKYYCIDTIVILDTIKLSYSVNIFMGLTFA